MREAEFRQAIEIAKAEDPFMYETIQISDASQGDLEHECIKFERDFDVKIPTEYRWFLARARCSEFGNAELMVLDHKATRIFGSETIKGAPDGFEPICDTGTGDYYGITLSDGGNSAILHFDHERSSCTETRFASFFEFAVSAGLNNIWE